jgi:uncharacterized membrane protein
MVLIYSATGFLMNYYDLLLIFICTIFIKAFGTLLLVMLFSGKTKPRLTADINNDLVQEDIVPLIYIVADSLKGGRI